jgi:hypothetical protein
MYFAWYKVLCYQNGKACVQGKYTKHFSQAYVQESVSGIKPPGIFFGQPKPQKNI